MVYAQQLKGWKRYAMREDFLWKKRVSKRGFMDELVYGMKGRWLSYVVTWRVFEMEK